MQQPSYITTPQGNAIAHVKHEGRSPTIMFCTGFKSDMTGSKALALEAFAKTHGYAFIRFDYSGHGKSGGDFLDGCIGDWREDALHVLDALISGPVVLVGSSMGAWIALLLALARPERICGLVGGASAPDFTERLIWDQFTDAQRVEMAAHGRVAVPNCYGDEPYIITQKLIDEGRKHLLLGSTELDKLSFSAQGASRSGGIGGHLPPNIIKVSCPIRLLHGTADEDVPWQISHKILEQVTAQDVRLTLIKGGNHRLSELWQLEMLTSAVYDIIKLQ